MRFNLNVSGVICSIQNSAARRRKMQLSFQLIWTRSQLESLLHFTEPAHITSGMTVVASAVRVMEGRVVSSLNANH